MGKTEMKTEMERVPNYELVGEENSEFMTADDITKQRNDARRQYRSVIRVEVKKNTPLEHVFMSAKLLSLIDDVFSTTKADKIEAKFGNCEAVVIENTSNYSIATGIYALYKNAKKSLNEGTLGNAYSVLVSEGKCSIEMDKYAFSFRVVK